ncbi:MAG: phenylacetic acid degradation operon negative regulatory protein PaaX [Casimicrobiaceae bacterium]
MKPRADPAIARWIRRELAVAPPRAKSLVVTVWGDALAPHDGTVWLSGLIRLLAPLGINERLVRTSVYRLTAEGWFAARQAGRRSVYRLTARGRRRFEHAYRRIYAPPADAWDGRWDLMLARASGTTRLGHRKLREALGWEGYAAIMGGVYARPARRGQTPPVEILAALGLDRDVTLLRARDLQRAPLPLQSRVLQCWDLARLDADYRRFIRRFRPVVRLLHDDAVPDPAQCFVVRTLLIHEFRRVTLHDPRLPAAMLPVRWRAHEAYALCRDFYRHTYRWAEQHLAATLETDGGPLPPAAAYFYARFGGLGPA